MRFLKNLILGAGVGGLIIITAAGRAATTSNSTPDFGEVYGLIRSHIAGESEADLNRAAVQGLLEQLHSKVWLSDSSMETNSPRVGPLLAKTSIYDGTIAYFRVAQVEQGLAGQIAEAYKNMNATNRLKGVVLDLRFADGRDYPAAMATADLFLSKRVPLLDWGKGTAESKAKTNAISLPVTVLVNHETGAAAEALAAVLRSVDRGVLLGGRTAGAATIGKEFPLKNGQYLRIATSDIKLGDGEKLSAEGLKPDIEVAVKSEDEKAWLADPFKDPAAAIGQTAGAEGKTGMTNRAPRTTEADLIRERKERPGMELDYAAMADSDHVSLPEKPAVRDPVLARALDLIKGISVMRRANAE